MPIMSSSYALPPVKRAGRRLGYVVGGTVLAIAGIVGYFYIDSKITPQHVVIVENGNAFPVEVDMAGEHVTIAAGQHTSIRAHDGTLTATATGPNHFTETSNLELPATGFTTAGRVALYNVGGASELALVTMTYGLPTAGRPKSPVQLIDHKDKLVLLPANAHVAIDEPFPTEVKTKRSGEVLVHVCHADVEKHQLGCANVN